MADDRWVKAIDLTGVKCKQQNGGNQKLQGVYTLQNVYRNGRGLTKQRKTWSQVASAMRMHLIG